jgi:hypothetical protein
MKEASGHEENQDGASNRWVADADAERGANLDLVGASTK